MTPTSPVTLSREEDRVWLVLCTGTHTHVLPVTLAEGVYTLAPGHYVSPTCGCKPVMEENPMTPDRLVSHVEPSWPGASLEARVQ